MRSALPGVAYVDVIPNGVDLDKFTPLPMAAAREALGWRPTGSMLLFAGDPDEPRKTLRSRARSRRGCDCAGSTWSRSPCTDARNPPWCRP